MSFPDRQSRAAQKKIIKKLNLDFGICYFSESLSILENKLKIGHNCLSWELQTRIARLLLATSPRCSSVGPLPGLQNSYNIIPHFENGSANRLLLDEGMELEISNLSFYGTVCNKASLFQREGAARSDAERERRARGDWEARARGAEEDAARLAGKLHAAQREIAR
ncbi:unnamed protein product [Parnassius mnemosyne]|uniref:Uncharacterized protein n=1 Tax=Parnassius mnemosyne TaxID=213953 RepID=A0AAV1KGP9_9NEOP